MKWLVMVLIMALCVMLIVSYALLVMANEERERANRMYRLWKESRDGRFDKEV